MDRGGGLAAAAKVTPTSFFVAHSRRNCRLVLAVSWR